MIKLFDEFIGKQVKASFIDGSQYRIARGILEEEQNGFVKITGRLGTIFVNIKHVSRIGLDKHNTEYHE